MVGGVCVWEGCGGAWDTCCPLGQGRSHHGAISGECDTRGTSLHGSVLVAGGRCCWGTWWGPGWWLGHLGRPGDGSLVPGCEAGLVGENVRESLKKLGPGARPWSHAAACGWEGLVLRGAVGQAPGLCSGTLHVALRSTGTWPHRHLMMSSSTGWQLPRRGSRAGACSQDLSHTQPASRQGWGQPWTSGNSLAILFHSLHLSWELFAQCHRDTSRCPLCLVFCLMWFAF